MSTLLADLSTLLRQMADRIDAELGQAKQHTINRRITITPALLQSIYDCNADLANRYAPHLDAYMRDAEINTRNRAAAFLAQIGHESGRLRHAREIWGPTHAQQRYEGRADLGNTQPGDGSRYRGRGLIQITGRSNYQQVSSALGVDFVSQPELLETPQYAVQSATWFWTSRRLNQLADAGDVVGITRRINGGLNGLDDRQSLHVAALQQLPATA